MTLYEFAISTNSKGQALPSVKVVSETEMSNDVIKIYQNFREEIKKGGIDIASEPDEYEIKENAKQEGQLSVKGTGKHIIEEYLSARKRLENKEEVKA